MRHRLPSRDAAELRSPGTRPIAAPLRPSSVEGLLTRVARGLTTYADARRLRILLGQERTLKK
jgi:hypothetical protein